ncbi:MAG TPA: glycosyltransferase [Candidatus Saccharimonadales bacterium]|nr:glycosyltransferase [Candidatus Saccharimonadales bacterium]
MRVAIIAPPWLALPIVGYGGIEVVLEGLVSGLLKLGVEVEIFGNGERKLSGLKTHSLYDIEQYYNIDRPVYESLPILAAHMEFSLNKIKEDGKFDIIHDHNGFHGPELLAWATRDCNLPPAVHTIHGPPFSNKGTLSQGLPDNRPFWEQFGGNMGRLYVIGISNTLMKPAPKQMRNHILPTVYNAIEIEKFPYVKNKKNYFVTLGRFSRDKGQHVAARICAKKGLRLRMAGTINGIGSNRKLMSELANPLSSYRYYRDFRYYSDKVLPYTLKYEKITYSGNLSFAGKMKFLSESKALLFPIDWEEPFGMVVIEALACGTPVIAMNRGAMPEIIEHGVNGFLANNEKEFEEYVDRIDEIDPAACRKSVKDNFSADCMAAAYLERYKQAIKLNGKNV